MLHQIDALPHYSDQTSGLHDFTASSAESILNLCETLQPGNSGLRRDDKMRELFPKCC